MGEARRKLNNISRETKKPENAPECYGDMFRENGQLQYGSMICDEEFCGFSERCRKDSKVKMLDKIYLRKYNIDS